jgi:integrase
VSAVFRRALALGHVNENPAAGIERGRERVIPIPLVSLDAQDALIEELPVEMRPLFVAALETGARLGELLRLRRADIDLPQKVLQIAESKSGRPRLVRMSLRLETTLHALLQGDASPPTGLLFADAVGADGKLRWRWRRVFKRAAASIGVPELRIHDLRHLHAVALVRAGIDLPTVQAQLGHRHLVSTLRYAAYADESASARAARALDALRNGREERRQHGVGTHGAPGCRSKF